MLDPLLAAGRLPTVQGLLERGSGARLESTKVPISSAAWVGAVTGKTPGHNGVYSFFEPVEHSYDVQLISSRSNRASPLWRILGWHGLRSIVFGVPVTFPPERIEGVMVAGMLSPFDADYAHPKVLTQRLRARGFVPDLGTWRERQEVTFERVREQLAIKEQILHELLRQESWSLAMIVFKDLDVWCHRAFDGRTDGSVAEHYALLDATLGRLLATVGPDVDVILMSDHGFHAYREGFFVLPWLVEHGFAVPSAQSVRAPIAQSANLAEKRAVEHQAMLELLDLERTAAFGGACEANFGGIRLNLAGREPKGSVAPERAEQTLTAIERALRAWRAPGREAPVVLRVHRASELYPGPFAERLPDLIFELDPSVVARNEPASKPYAASAQHFPDHALEGIWIQAGPSFAHRPERGDASIFDLAPTVLALLDLPVYSEMQGRVLEQTFAAPRAVRRCSQAEDPAAASGYKPSDSDYDERGLDEVKSRLRETGYAQ
jgi:predicted AlkP superfamily phosphohydrolase/phosphomutase